MEILWLAIIIYSIGLVVVLHFKPSLMFNENGTWKEFGYQRSSSTDLSRYTIFPFWLFSITWAFLSYASVVAAMWVFQSRMNVASLATASTVASSFGAYHYENRDSDGPSEERISGESEEGPSGESEEGISGESEEGISGESEAPNRNTTKSKTPINSRKYASKPRQGYYIVDPHSDVNGLRKYVYYGPNPPPS